MGDIGSIAFVNIQRSLIDPVEAADGPNLYTYDYNSPLNFIDPLGLIGSPGNVDSPTRAFWEAMRRGDWRAARSILDDAAEVGRATPKRLETLRKGIDRAEKCEHELKRLGKLSRKDLQKTLKNRQKTLDEHLEKPYRKGVDDPETIYIRQQIEYIKELLGIPQ